MRWRKVSLGLAGIMGLLVLYLFCWPVPIDPVAWRPPEAPKLVGVYELNTRLASVERLGVGTGVGPEDVAVDSQGQIYGGLEDGRVMRFQPDGSEPEVFADTGGRPLGLHFDAAGNLIVADAYKGLLSIAPDGSIAVLSTEQGGVPYGLTNDVDIAADGTIFFSDTTFKFGVSEHVLDLSEHQPNGRLLAYDPHKQATRLVLDGLYFANGVAVSPDQSFVLVVETGKYRVRRYWLTGPRQEESEVFIDNLPGFPDGVSSNEKGTFWLALVSPRKSDVDSILLPNPLLRKIIARLPESLFPAAENYGFILGLDMEGHVVHNLQDPSASYAQISSVQEHEGILYLGSVHRERHWTCPTQELE